jgi:hydroxymethylglutaryl-CoA reductase (NADPH)
MSAVKPYIEGICVFDNVLDESMLESMQKLANDNKKTTSSSVDGAAAVDESAKGGLCAAEALPSTSTPTTGTSTGSDYASLTDEEIVALVRSGGLKDHQLEAKLGDCERAVAVRRTGFENVLNRPLNGLPYENYCYDQVLGANCEVVVGYVPLPCGMVGPLKLDGEDCFIPMATTEGCLVASTNRGAKAISKSGGASSVILKDGITRAPCLLLPSASEAAKMKLWIDEPENFQKLKDAFQSTTNFGRLVSADATVAGRNIFVRFVCFAGDAMGMNMVSKGTLAAVAALQEAFKEAQLVSVSGNMCSDKKPAAVNWIEGRGKSVICEALIKKDIVESVLKTTVSGMVEVGYRKNMVGSAMAGSVGGFNAHAANLVSSVFLACGQDPAQVVESANCITLLEAIPAADGNGDDLHISVTMPSIEVGTVGGGTSLPAQAACLDVMGVRGAARAEGQKPGDNARRLGSIVAAATLAGELSLLAALASNDLVKSHMQHNRKKA